MKKGSFKCGVVCKQQWPNYLQGAFYLSYNNLEKLTSMKVKIVFNILFCLITIGAFGQADLIATSASIQTTNISIGDYLIFKFRVKNIGNATAPKSHTKIYISQPTSSGAIGIFLGEISTESLAANTETQDIIFTRPLPYNVPNGKNYIDISVDEENEVYESNSMNNAYTIPSSLTVNSVIGPQQNLPYPIIFIHGLNADNSTWDPFKIDVQKKFGCSYGGNMNFCLNQDGDNNTSSRATDYRDYTYLAPLQKADFYTVNFNVGTDGLDQSALSWIINDVKSNKSAIVKQGWAIQDAVRHVLEITGRDKVILVGHSMGGLAAREYLQNKNNWQSDNQHHVAKLLTIGTPHGGSNASFPNLITSLIGLDERSEAVRDLKTSYPTSGKQGVYLFGGQELYSVMDRTGFLTPSYYNVDVNCNGLDNDGILIKGLNQKTLPLDLNYSCIIGTGALTTCNNGGSGFEGDDIVCEFSSNLKTYYSNYTIDTFVSRQPYENIKIWHTELPKQTEVILKGLDESNEYSQSYVVETNKLYFGSLTDQSKAPLSYLNDYDDYSFKISKGGILNTKIYNIPLSQCYMNLLDSSQKIIYRDSSNGKGYWELNNTLKAGNYFFEIFGTPTSNSWLTQYGFQLNYTSILPVTLLEFVARLIQNQVAALNWSTINEVNTEKFGIEHSANGEDWNTLGVVNAVNLSSRNGYDFTDLNPNNGINYYRLKMVDKDGNFTYSEIRIINIIKEEKPFTISPNPATSVATLNFNSPINAAEISITDAQGKMVSIESMKGNLISSYQLNTAQLLIGLYLVTVKTASATQTEKLLIAR